MAYCDGTDPRYYAVLFTDPYGGHDPEVWSATLRLMAALAEAQPGYEGYTLEPAEGGREYAVTWWSSPKSIAAWKRGVDLLVTEKAVLSDLYGKEGCLWPWMKAARAA